MQNTKLQKSIVTLSQLFKNKCSYILISTFFDRSMVVWRILNHYFTYNIIKNNTIYYTF